LGVIENRVLRRIFRPKREEIMEDWSKLNNGECRNLYISPVVFRMAKPKRLR
jgi:hypothetical protein